MRILLILALVVLGLSWALLCLGIVEPATVIFWGKQENKTYKKAHRLFRRAAILLFLLIIVVPETPPRPAPPEPADDTSTALAAKALANTGQAQRPALDYRVLESFDLAPYKWQVTLLVPKQDGDKFPDQAELEALAQKVAKEKYTKLGLVKRWWVSFQATAHDRAFYADVHYDAAEGITPPRFSWFIEEYERTNAFKLPPKPAHQSLKIGDEITLSRLTSLMPELDPPDPLSVWNQIVKLPAGAKIKVLQVAIKDNTTWYRVNAEARHGWINSVALLGQVPD